MPHQHPALSCGLLIGWAFALPCLAQTHHRSQSTTNAVLKEVLQQYLKQQGVENDSSTQYIAAFVDLNDDGNKEVILYVISPSLCGTGGCPTLLLSPQQSSLRIVSRISITRPPIRVLNTRSHGWRELAVWVAGGGIHPGYEAELPFDGKSYATNPTVAPARRLSLQSAGRTVISDGSRPTPLN